MEKESYTRSEIYELLWTEPATKVALRIGISDVALGKWCKQYGVPKPPLGYWAKLEHGKVTGERPILEPWWNEHDPLIHVRTRDKAIMEARLNKPAEPIPVIQVYKGNKFHPEIERTFDDFEMDNITKFGRSSSQAGFDVQVGPSSVPRVKRILQTLIQELLSRGYALGVYERHSKKDIAGFEKGDEILMIDFYESSTKPLRPMKKKSSWVHNGQVHTFVMNVEYVPSGNLELRIHHNDIYGWRTIKDSKKTSVENQLGKVITLFEELSFDAKIIRAERKERDRRDEIERKRLADIKWAKEVEVWKWGQLAGAAERWDELAKIRGFVRAIKNNRSIRRKNKDLSEWVSWAVEQINARDPVFKVASGMSLPGQNAPIRGEDM
jgi:hypothetical protein